MPKRIMSFDEAQEEWELLLNVIENGTWEEIGKFLDGLEIVEQSEKTLDTGSEENRNVGTTA